MNYYNENDKKAAAWLRQLMADGLIAQGEIDERSIREVQPDDVRGFKRCHFFAGIGGWEAALQLANWPANKEVWTCSCPCQPYSNAGQGKGDDDERNLWPDFFRIARVRRPDVIFGEQVAAAIRFGWLDGISTDLEAEGYAIGSIVLGAHSAGAPHQRQRLYWVANSLSRGWRKGFAIERPSAATTHVGDASSIDTLVTGLQRAWWGLSRPREGNGTNGSRSSGESGGSGHVIGVAVASSGELARRKEQSARQELTPTSRGGGVGGMANTACTEGARFGQQSIHLSGSAIVRGGESNGSGQCDGHESSETPRYRDCIGPDGSVGDAARRGLGTDGSASRESGHAEQSKQTCVGTVANTSSDARAQYGQESREQPIPEPENGAECGRTFRSAEQPEQIDPVGNTSCDNERRERKSKTEFGWNGQDRGSGFWSSFTVIQMRDGKSRRIPRIERVLQPMVDGFSDGVDGSGPEGGFPLCEKIEGRTMLLKGYSNAVVVPLAVEFIKAVMELNVDR